MTVGILASRNKGLLLGLVLLLIVAVFLAEPFYRHMMQQFERTAFEQVVRQIQVACNARVMEAKAFATSQVLEQWLGHNPVDCLKDKTLSSWDYAGEMDTSEEIEPGRWAYDLELQRLVYYWRDPKGLQNADPDPRRIQFRLLPEFADSNQNGQREAEEAINGLHLVAEYNYHWKAASRE